jgi:hypothetical protein
VGLDDLYRCRRIPNLGIRGRRLGPSAPTGELLGVRLASESSPDPLRFICSKSPGTGVGIDRDGSLQESEEVSLGKLLGGGCPGPNTESQRSGSGAEGRRSGGETAGGRDPGG